MDIDALAREAVAAIRPPPKLALSEWIERSIYLPSSLAAQPGRMRLFPPQIEIADAMGDAGIERVTLLKSARVGATQLMTAALGSFVQNDPCPVLAVLPSETDARHMVVSVIEPTFDESPTLRQALREDASGRDTLFTRHFAGGSLTVVSAGSPRNLRARTARVLLLDEVDAYEVSAGTEGDPVSLAIRRTQTFADRKIVMASTPVDAETSRIAAAYAESDQRVFELPCPHCGDFHEITWAAISWPEGKPQEAAWACPSCGALSYDTDKAEMVSRGRWRALRPEVKGHAGFKLTSLTSTLPNTSWADLAAEFLVAKKSPATLKPFVNTVLGEPWQDFDAGELERFPFLDHMAPFALDSVPPDVVAITAGADVQLDRLEVSYLGHADDGRVFVLAHELIWGSPREPETWQELDERLSRQIAHPSGGYLYVDACLIDSGGSGWASQVYDFARPRGARRIFASKGVSGWGRPLAEFSTSKRIRLVLVGVDGGKQAVQETILAGQLVKFSDQLTPDYFDQLRGEKLVTVFSRGVPVKRWEAISGRRNEALDCFCYALAAKRLLSINPERRAAQIEGKAPPPPKRVHRSAFLGR